MTRNTLSGGLRLVSRATRRHTPTAQMLCPMHRAQPSSLRGHRPRTSTSLPSLARPFSTTFTRTHGHVDPPKPGEEVYVTFIDRDKVAHKIACNIGDNLLDIAQAHDLDVEGACGGSCACSTCHVIVEDEEIYDKLPPESEDEGDMLDLAFGLTNTSRLGCQVEMTKEIDGIVVRLPSATRNLQAKDFA